MDKESQTNSSHNRLARLQRQRYRRYRQRRVTIAITIAVIVALLIGVAILILSIKGKSNTALPDEHSSEEATAQQTQDDNGKYSTVTIAAVGDISISDAQLLDARTDDRYDFSHSFLGVAGLLSETDLTVGNLECNLRGAPYGTETNSAPTAFADTLAGLGFDLLQTANSVSISGGLAGLKATMDNLESAGIQPVGTFRTEQERRECGGVTIREVNGIRVAFLAFTKGLNNMSLPENSEYAINLLYTDYDTNYSQLNTDGIVAAMEAAKKENPDIIIAMVHWGSENSREVSASQKRVAKLLYENGADAIIGTHAHLVGEIETSTVTLENGTTKDVVTAYDLGNFYTDSTRAGTQTSLILRLEFTRNNWTDQTTLTDFSYTPVYCADFGTLAADRYQILSIENAMELYRQEYVYRVSDETYEVLQKEMEALPSYITPPDEES